MKPFFERKIGQLQPENHACSLCRFFLTDKNIQNTLKAKTSTEIDLLRVMSNFIVRTKVHCSEKDATFIRIYQVHKEIGMTDIFFLKTDQVIWILEKVTIIIKIDTNYQNCQKFTKLPKVN